MSGEISKAARQTAFELAGPKSHTPRPQIVYAEKRTTREWRGFGGWSEHITWNVTGNSMELMLLSMNREYHALVDRATGEYELHNAPGGVN